MLGAGAELIPYALLATLSPLGAAATIAVMRSGRWKALAFGIGVVLGQLLACAALVALGVALSPDRSKSHPTLTALLEIAAGVALLCLAVAVKRRPALGPRPSSGRTRAALDRLERVHAFTAWAIGVLLGIGGPKRLVLTCLAAASIAASGTTGSDPAALVAWYTLLATLLVWFPVVAYLVAGDWAAVRLDAGLAWLGRHSRPLLVYAAAFFGAALLIEGVALI